ncbi:MAG: alkaline ceramidase [Deltaproteobacteria bacterium]|nr:alkaline ceramidase [Deltaproteobacteria bacterium]
MNALNCRLNRKSWRTLRQLVFALSTIACSVMSVMNAATAVAAHDGTKSCEGYLVGAAHGDITGPIVGVGMMGYAELGQIDEGIHTRLWSRALVVSDRCKKQTVAFINADLAMIFDGVRRAVIERLAVALPGVFDETNLMISATHTHAGPGGFAHHALYNITTRGFNPQNFHAIVEGIVASVIRAHREQQPAQLSIATGHLVGYQFNRSPESFARNPESEQQLFPTKADTEMVLIKAISDDGRPIAAFNWFPVHGVSLPISNRLVSGDNKGVAAQFFERKFGTTYLHDHEFVAGFVQANSGDISPYDVSHGPDSEKDGFGRNEWSARGQFQKAFELYHRPDSEVMTGPVAAVHRYEDLAYRQIDAAFTGDASATTCQAVLGESFAAGTPNGMPFPIFKSHAIYGQTWPKFTLMPREQECHQEKVLLLPTGFVKPNPWTPRIAPFQIIRIGSLAIIGAPFEVTTVAGYRLKQEIKRRLIADGVRHVVLSGLTNEYIHYVTTREEYQAQAYEGGANLYGPWSLAAYTEIFVNLADDMVSGRQRPPAARPPDLSSKQLVIPKIPIHDIAPQNSRFGDVRVDVADEYRAGDTVTVEFWGAHPNNAHRPGFSHLTVETLKGDTWHPVYFDWDHETRMHWHRYGVGKSIIQIAWSPAEDSVSATYRICHHGKSKSLFSQGFTPYSGCSRAFRVLARDLDM